MIRVKLPTHLRRLTGVNGEVELQVEGVITQRTVVGSTSSRLVCTGCGKPRSCSDFTRASGGMGRVMTRTDMRSPEHGLAMQASQGSQSSKLACARSRPEASVRVSERACSNDGMSTYPAD